METIGSEKPNSVEPFLSFPLLNINHRRVYTSMKTKHKKAPRRRGIWSGKAKEKMRINDVEERSLYGPACRTKRYSSTFREYRKRANVDGAEISCGMSGNYGNNQPPTAHFEDISSLATSSGKLRFKAIGRKGEWSRPRGELTEKGMALEKYSTTISDVSRYFIYSLL